MFLYKIYKYFPLILRSRLPFILQRNLLLAEPILQHNLLSVEHILQRKISNLYNNIIKIYFKHYISDYHIKLYFTLKNACYYIPDGQIKSIYITNVNISEKHFITSLNIVKYCLLTESSPNLYYPFFEYCIIQIYKKSNNKDIKFLELYASKYRSFKLLYLIAKYYLENNNVKLAYDYFKQVVLESDKIKNTVFFIPSEQNNYKELRYNGYQDLCSNSHEFLEALKYIIILNNAGFINDPALQLFKDKFKTLNTHIKVVCELTRLSFNNITDYSSIINLLIARENISSSIGSKIKQYITDPIAIKNNKDINDYNDVHKTIIQYNLNDIINNSTLTFFQPVVIQCNNGHRIIIICKDEYNLYNNLSNKHIILNINTNKTMEYSINLSDDTDIIYIESRQTISLICDKPFQIIKLSPDTLLEYAKKYIKLGRCEDAYNCLYDICTNSNNLISGYNASEAYHLLGFCILHNIGCKLSDHILAIRCFKKARRDIDIIIANILYQQIGKMRYNAMLGVLVDQSYNKGTLGYQIVKAYENKNKN